MEIKKEKDEGFPFRWSVSHSFNSCMFIEHLLYAQHNLSPTEGPAAQAGHALH